MVEHTRLQEYTGNKDTATEAYLQGLQGIPLGVLANVLPPVTTGADSTDWTNYLPLKGMAGLAYSGITGLAELGANKIGKPAAQFMQQLSPGFASVTPTIPNEDVRIPGGEAARHISEESVRGVLDTIPHVEATTEAGKLGQDIGIGIGQGASMIAPPGITALPKVLSIPLRTALPPASTAGIGAALGGVSGALAAPEGEALPVIGQIGESKKQEVPAVIGQQGTPVAPLSPENDTGLGYAQTAGVAAVATGLTWLAARYGPKGINVASDLLRGRSRNIVDLNALVDSPIPRMDKPVEMLLPGDAGGQTRRWATNAYNPNAVGNEYSKAIAATPDEARMLVATNEMVNNPANANRRMESLFRTGTEEGTGHSFPKIIDYKRAWDGLSEGQKANANYAAWFKNELNIRNANMRSGLVEPDARVSFLKVDTNVMRQHIATAEADPAVKKWLDMNKSIQSAIVDSYEQRGYITKGQADQARNVYPDFMPTIGADGQYLHSWDGKMREPGSGYKELPTDAWQAMINHFDKSIRSAQKNDWQRSVMLRQLKEQAANPAGPKIITETAEPSALRRSLTINTADGPRHFDIHNSAFHQWITANPQMMGNGASMVNWVRQFYQNTTTGPIAMAFGHPFAIKQAMRDTMLIPAQAGAGARRGYLDKAFNTRLPYDPTFLVGSAITGAKDASTVVASHLADTLGNRTNPMSAAIRKAFGHDAVDTWVDWIRSRIKNTRLAERTAQGVGGGGNRLTQDMKSFIADKTGKYRDPTASAVSPMLSRPNFVLIPDSVPLPGVVKNTVNGVVRGGAESYINLRSLARDLYNVISDAPHSFYYDINVGNPKFNARTLAAEVQTVTGNPGTRGSGRITQAVSNTLPYYNTSVQGIGRSLAAFRDRPIATGITAATILIPLALAEHLSALVSGKEHMQHLEEETANGTKARNAIIYHGPKTDPNVHTELPIPNEWQAIKPFISGLVGHMIGSWDAHDDPNMLSRIAHMVSGMFDHHVTTDVLQQMGIGLVSGYVPLDVGPMGQALVAATTGEQVKSIPEQMISNAISGNPLGDKLTIGGGQQHHAPGQGGSDGLLTRTDSGVFKAMMSALGAAGAVSYDMATNFMHRMKVDHEWAWTGLIGDYKQEWQDQTPYANHIWQHNLKQSTYGSLEERTNNMWNNIQSVIAGHGEIKGEGFSSATRGVPLMMNTEETKPKDPQMMDLYLHTAQMGKSIQREIMPEISKIRAQLDNLKNGTFLPDERRRIQNKLSTDLYGQYTKLHERLLDLNAQLSERADGRHVDVGSKIDWQGSIEQFHY